MINKKLFIFIVFLLLTLINLVIVQSNHEYNSPEFYKNSNPKEWDYSKVNWQLVPVDKIKDIPADKLIYSELNANQKKAMMAEQIQANFDKIPDLKEVEFSELRKAVFSAYSVDIADINQGASLVGGVLQSTFGVYDKLDLSNKAGWAIKINDDGRIVVTNNEISGTQVKDGDKFTISKANLDVNLKRAEVEGLSFKDGNYYVKQGDIASIDSYKINALSTDVLVNFDGGKRLELLKTQTELNDALKESRKVWTGKVTDLYNQRESLKSILGLSQQSSSSQILAGIYGSSQNSVIFGDNSILVNGNGFSVTDGVKVITPQGGNILSIARDSQPTLDNLIKGKGRIDNGNFVYGLGEKMDNIGVEQFLSANKPKESIGISNEQTATIVSPKGQNEIIVQKGQTASQLVGGYTKAIGYDTIYTFPDGTSKRGPEVDFEKLPIGTRISFDTDFADNPVEVSKNPQPYDERTKNLDNTIKSGMGEVAKTLKVPLTPEEVNGICKVESCRTDKVTCRERSCGPFQTTPEAIVEAGTKFEEFGTKIKVDDIKKMSPEEQLEYIKKMPIEDLATAGVLHYGIVKNSIYNVCKTCSEDTKLGLALIANNLGPTATRDLIINYKNEYGEFPKTIADFKDYLTVDNLKKASPGFYGNAKKFSDRALVNKIGIVKNYQDKVIKAMRR